MFRQLALFRCTGFVDKDPAVDSNAAFLSIAVASVNYWLHVVFCNVRCVVFSRPNMLRYVSAVIVYITFRVDLFRLHGDINSRWFSGTIGGH